MNIIFYIILVAAAIFGYFKFIRRPTETSTSKPLVLESQSVTPEITPEYKANLTTLFTAVAFTDSSSVDNAVDEFIAEHASAENADDYLEDPMVTTHFLIDRYGFTTDWKGTDELIYNLPELLKRHEIDVAITWPIDVTGEDSDVIARLMQHEPELTLVELATNVHQQLLTQGYELWSLDTDGDYYNFCVIRRVDSALFKATLIALFGPNQAATECDHESLNS